jgi:tetratricopeptide (TPR) repeat protein
MNKSSIKIARSKKSSSVWLLILTTSITTIYFNTEFLDPFNTPKLIIITLLGAWLLGHVVDSFRNNSRKLFLSDIKIIILPILFTISLFISFVFTDNQIVGLLGESTRRNGLLMYIALVALLLFAVQNMNFIYTLRLLKVSIITGVILSSYGLIQISGNDFVAWNNPFNSMISTLGNPNFASAMLAILSLIGMFSIFIKSLNLFFKIASIGYVLTSMYAIFESESKQGLLVLAFGVLFYFGVYSYYRYLKLRLLIIPSIVAISFLAVLGMLQKGPLEYLLYKNSVSVRGYYWRAGISMLRDHLLTGVGIDRYGSYFKEYREPEYGLINGFTLTSSNAHNTFIQFFATGGLILGLSYLILILYILKTGLLLVNRYEGENRKVILSILSAWVGFQSQSMISIDNIGISIWGWVLGGTILGIYRNEITVNNLNLAPETQIKKNIVKINLFQPILSFLLIIPALFTSFFMYQFEHNSYLIRGMVQAGSEEIRNSAIVYAKEVFNNPVADPNYKFQIANALYESRISLEGYYEVKKLHELDKRNLDYLLWLAIYEAEKENYGNAIEFREQIIKYDPWNAENYLQLGLLFKSNGYPEKARDMLFKINSFAGENEISKIAQESLG